MSHAGVVIAVNGAVVTDLDIAMPPVSVDLGALSQVFLNLYLNARDAMLPKSGGTLTITGTAGDGLVTIHVRDTGTGIPEAIRDRMFEPLTTTKGERGTGLGLSVSKRVIESAGGRISFETEDGRGTTFSISLPVACDPLLAMPPTAAPAQRATVRHNSPFQRPAV